MIRLHPNIKHLSKKLRLPHGIINVTDYEDMQELVAACDCMITDYSSTIIEAGIAGKKGFVFALDWNTYKKDRNAYFDLQKDLPFPFSESSEALIKCINSFDENDYTNRLNSFLYRDYGIICTGNASEKICEIIKRQVGI